LPNNVLDFTYRLQVKVLETHFTKLEHHLGHYAQAAVASESSQTIRRANGAEAFEASLVSIDESGNYRMTITAGPGY
jgi:hypothetical protein